MAVYRSIMQQFGINSIYERICAYWLTSGSVECLRHLIGNLVNERANDGNSAIHYVCIYGWIECLKELIENEAVLGIMKWPINSVFI